MMLNGAPSWLRPRLHRGAACFDPGWGVGRWSAWLRIQLLSGLAPACWGSQSVLMGAINGLNFASASWDNIFLSYRFVPRWRLVWACLDRRSVWCSAPMAFTSSLGMALRM